jgi:malonate decarboxylase holo-[acyl-carrier-protein] synthase
LTLRRHCFAWCSDAASFFDAGIHNASPVDLANVQLWLESGLPVMVRRPCVSEDGRAAFVGIALPPMPIKRRLAFCLPIRFITKLVDPPLWKDCLALASPETAASTESIETAAAASGLHLRTCGSYAWQYHTALAYVAEQSDVDLLVPVNHRASWKTFRQSMEGIGQKSPRTDLEIVLNGDASFSWWEFTTGGSRMLFKGNHSVWIGDKSTVERFLDDQHDDDVSRG